MATIGDKAGTEPAHVAVDKPQPEKEENSPQCDSELAPGAEDNTDDSDDDWGMDDLSDSD